MIESAALATIFGVALVTAVMESLAADSPRWRRRWYTLEPVLYYPLAAAAYVLGVCVVCRLAGAPITLAELFR
jgi:hypothetical protein